MDLAIARAPSLARRAVIAYGGWLVVLIKLRPTRSVICWRVGIFQGSLNGVALALPGVFMFTAGGMPCIREVLVVEPVLLVVDFD